MRASDWPQFLGPTRNGVYGEKDLAESWPKEGPRIVWQKTVGQGFSGPVVSDGKLILFHRLNDKAVIDCFDARTGKPRWSFTYPASYQDDFGFDEGPRATPAIADARIYAFGAEGVLHCLDLETGRKIWSVNTKVDFDAPKGFFGMACSPLIEGTAVLLNIGGRPGAGIVAFDKNSGKLLWKATDHEASYSSPVATTIDGKRSVFFFTRRGLVAIEPESGAVGFEFPWCARMGASVNAATPLIIGDLIFISSSYGVGATLLRIDNGNPEKVWAADDVLSNHYATAAHDDGFLYGFDGRQEEGPNLRCVELKTGKVRWSKDRFGAGTVTLANKNLLILKETGEIVLARARPDQFQPLAQAQILPSGVRAYPALADGFFFARSKDKLVGVDLRKSGSD